MSEEKLKAGRVAEHMPLNIEDPDSITPTVSQLQYGKQIILNTNIYNAYIISKYKMSEREKWKQASWLTKFYISILPYFIAVVQWAAVIILAWVQFEAFEGKEDNVDEFSLGVGQHWAPKLLMWPFWFIALSYTYAKSLEYEVDIWALKFDSIVALDLSQTDTKCKCNLELFFFETFN